MSKISLITISIPRFHPKVEFSLNTFNALGLTWNYKIFFQWSIMLTCCLTKYCVGNFTLAASIIPEMKWCWRILEKRKQMPKTNCWMRLFLGSDALHVPWWFVDPNILLSVAIQRLVQGMTHRELIGCIALFMSRIWRYENM